MKIKNLLWFLPAFIFLSCDDLSSPYPAGRPALSFIDTNLTGLWKQVGITYYNSEKSAQNDTQFVAILPFNAKEYLLVPYTTGDSVLNGRKDHGFFKGFISTVGNIRVANLEAIDVEIHTTHDYLIYPFCIEKDTLYVTGFYAKKVAREFKSVREVRHFLKYYIHDTNLYSSVRKYIKIKEK
jgi:hypothetical protein